MALVHSLEKNGNTLFKYRGQIPLILFLLSIPVVFFTDYNFLKGNEQTERMLLVGCSIISLLGQTIRAIAIGTSNKHTSGRNTKEQVADALNTKGIYSIVRHPLYIGNYFMWIGIVMYTFNAWFTLTVSLLFWVYYERIMFAEERFLERKFGGEYLQWSMKVPAFVPSFRNYDPSPIPFSWKTILRREYSGVTATIFGFVFVAFFRNWFLVGQIEFKPIYGIVAFIALMITLIFRSLKHHTRLLFEEDRS
jgi:protein-S-isoprenylcysteine O-methyltransferase Ste14